MTNTSKAQYGVYFIYCGDLKTSPVKIGVSSDLESRITSLQTGNPYPLKCKAFIPCMDKSQAYSLEAYLHHRFRKSRLTGEWFNIFHFNLKSILSEYSKRRAIPLEKQGFNVVKKSNKEIVKLKAENKRLERRVKDLEEQIEEMYQEQLINEAWRL